METQAYHIRQASQGQPADHDKSFFNLILEDSIVPSPGDNEILLRIHAVSLNWRDVMLARGIMPSVDGVVACSDGAGEVVSVGPKVRRFRTGDRAMAIFILDWLSGPLNRSHATSALGGARNGMLTRYAVFNEEGLVKIPAYLTYEEASTLPCAGVTAWNALYGSGRTLRSGDVVVTQGTGGVSMFAAQLGLTAGAYVISTTSSQSKTKMLEDMGVKHVINYREMPLWGTKARQLTPDGEGADFVIEIGGPETFAQSIAATRPDGHIAIVGRRTAQGPSKSSQITTTDDLWANTVSTRKVSAGNRQHFEDFCRALAVNEIHPIVDSKVFAFEEARDAFAYLWESKHVGNVVIKVS